MAIERVEQLLRGISGALNRANLDYAIVGGNAVAAWVASVDEGAVRATKDVDILVRRNDMDQIAKAAAALNLMRAEVFGVHMLVDCDNPNPKTGVHFVMAGERIRPEYKHPAPDPGDSAMSASGFRLINLPELLAMKLQANRNIDRAHIEDLAAVGLISDQVRAELPQDLLERLQSIVEGD